MEDGIQSGGASRRADKQINIGRSRFIVMHPRYCVSKTLYVYISSCRGCARARLHARNSKGAKVIDQEERDVRVRGREGSGIEMRNRKRTKLGRRKGERLEGTRQKRSLLQINNRLFCPDANTDRGKEKAAFSLYFKREESLKGEVETRFLPFVLN